MDVLGIVDPSEKVSFWIDQRNNSCSEAAVVIRDVLSDCLVDPDHGCSDPNIVCQAQAESCWLAE